MFQSGNSGVNGDAVRRSHGFDFVLTLLSIGSFAAYGAKRSQEPPVPQPTESRLATGQILRDDPELRGKDVEVAEADVRVVRHLLSKKLAVSSAVQGTNQRGQETTQKEKPAPEARSFMELFTKLESDWIHAVQKKDKTALDAILAPEFMLRSSEDPENPLPRAEWIQHALSSYDIHSFSHRAMAIRAFLGVAVVSLVQTQQATMDGKNRDGEYLIVDIWEVNHDKWQISARYMAPVSNGAVGPTKTEE